MRRNELLGLCWDDLDIAKAALSINRGLVAIGYDLHETRGKTANARRRIDLDPTTIDVLHAWQQWQTIEQRAVGIDPTARMFADGRGEAIHPHAISQTFERIARRAGVRVIRLHDLRHTTAPCSSPPACRSRSSANDLVTPRRRSPSRPTSTCCPACRPTPPASSNSSSSPAFYRLRTRR